MKDLIGAGNRILEVDLTVRAFTVSEVSERDRLDFLGAKGLGLKLLFDRLTPGCDPLGPENILAVMPGVLLGTGAPCSGRFETLGKSPLTGIIATSSCGGPFGMALKTAGWGGLLIKGRADRPTWLSIDESGCDFHDAYDLWGLEIPEAQKRIEDKKTASLMIGPAGEHLVRMANIAAGHRFLGRGGLGAVMGSKNLKAVAARGGAFRIRPADPEKFSRVKKRAGQYIKKNEFTGDVYRKYGTAANVRLNLKNRILPVNNFQDGWHEKGDLVSGEVMAEKHETKHQTCKPCSILCGHKGLFQGREMSVPEYETVGLLGTSLGIFDPEHIARWNDICGRMGLDTISAGGTLAWVMEAAAKGLVTSDLCFGSAEGVDQALEDMAHCRGFGREMARGSRALAQRYGGMEFAMQVKGLELAGYDPRGCYGQGLSYAVANRGGCHLSAYMVAHEVYFNLLKPFSLRGKAKWVKFFEDLTCGLNSLQTCQFTMYAYLMEPPLTKYTPDPVLGSLMQHLPEAAIPLVDFTIYRDLWSAVTGLPLSSSGFLGAGERIHVLERYMNTREGITRRDDTLPDRLLRECRISDPEKRTVPLSKMLPGYYKLRGYDGEGIPTSKTLKRLGIVE